MCATITVAYPIFISPRWRAVHLPARPAARSPILLQGSFTSSFDGVIIDAVASRWPQGASAPSATGDRGGLFDLAAGGLQVLSYDAVAHSATVVSTGGPAPACARHGVASPCLVWRAKLAHSRLLTVGDWQASLRGQLTARNDGDVLSAGDVGAAHSPPGVAWLIALTAVLLSWLAAAVLRRRYGSAKARWQRARKRLAGRIERGDPVLEVTLRPVLLQANEAVAEGRLDPASMAGRSLTEGLLRLERCLAEQAEQHRRQAQAQLAEQLTVQLAVALEAAAEANNLVSRGKI